MPKSVPSFVNSATHGIPIDRAYAGKLLCLFIYLYVVHIYYISIAFQDIMTFAQYSLLLFGTSRCLLNIHFFSSNHNRDDDDNNTHRVLTLGFVFCGCRNSQTGSFDVISVSRKIHHSVVRME